MKYFHFTYTLLEEYNYLVSLKWKENVQPLEFQARTRSRYSGTVLQSHRHRPRSLNNIWLIAINAGNFNETNQVHEGC